MDISSDLVFQALKYVNLSSLISQMSRLDAVFDMDTAFCSTDKLD